MKPKDAPSLNRLVQKAREHRRESGDQKYWVSQDIMAALLLHQETEVISRRIQEGGLQYLEVMFRGERFVTVAKNLARLFPDTG